MSLYIWTLYYFQILLPRAAFREDLLNVLLQIISNHYNDQTKTLSHPFVR